METDEKRAVRERRKNWNMQSWRRKCELKEEFM